MITMAHPPAAEFRAQRFHRTTGVQIDAARAFYAHDDQIVRYAKGMVRVAPTAPARAVFQGRPRTASDILDSCERTLANIQASFARREVRPDTVFAYMREHGVDYETAARYFGTADGVVRYAAVEEPVRAAVPTPTSRHDRIFQYMRQNGVDYDTAMAKCSR